MPTTSYDEAGGPAHVEFRLPPEAGAPQAWLVGEFNGWSTSACPLQPVAGGGLAVTIVLDPGTYRFRYYLGEGAWENDWAADAYADNEHGGQDSVVVVPPPPAPPPPVKAAKKAAAKAKPAAKKAVDAVTTAVKKAAAKKKAATKKKAAPPND